MINQKFKFASFAEHVTQVRNLNKILHNVELLNQITLLLNKRLPHLVGAFHCGAVDFSGGILVIYAKSNGAFYKLNQNIRQIQDALAEEYYSFAQILFKTSPQAQTQKIKSRTTAVGPQEQEMLAKFAQAIGRPDLLKANLAAEKVSTEDWAIQL
jgi:hypothetical protein